jgi:predicted amidohydrolase YtcJ
VAWETEKLLSWGQGMTAYLPRQVKLFVDGAIFSQAMQVTGGYADGHEGEWMMDPDFFARSFRVYWDLGYQIHVHVNGDAVLDMVLDHLELNMRRRPRNDHRTVIVHFALSRPAQVTRIGRLGALEAVTLDAAYSLQMEEKVGSIVADKLANFTILAANPLTVDPSELKDIAVWGTVHEGRVLPAEREDGDGRTVVLGPVRDASTVAASIEADHHDHGQGRQGDACSAARHLTRAVAASGASRRAGLRMEEREPRR